MAVSAISLSDTVQSAELGTGSGLQAVSQKINQLEKQKSNYEKELEDSTDSQEQNELKSKISSLEARIETLKQRLENGTEETDAESAGAAKTETDDGECETCKNRKYQDGSDDPGVSFKSATKLSPEEASSAVRGHEMEHVYRNQAKASREDRRVVSQSVTIKTAICPECGKAYVSGGETKTVTKAKQENRFDVGLDSGSTGGLLDAVA